MQNKVVKVTKTRFFCFFQPESSSLCCTQFWETKIKQTDFPSNKSSPHSLDYRTTAESSAFVLHPKASIDVLCLQKKNRHLWLKSNIPSKDCKKQKTERDESVFLWILMIFFTSHFTVRQQTDRIRSREKKEKAVKKEKVSKFHGDLNQTQNCLRMVLTSLASLSLLLLLLCLDIFFKKEGQRKTVTKICHHICLYILYITRKLHLILLFLLFLSLSLPSVIMACFVPSIFLFLLKKRKLPLYFLCVMFFLPTFIGSTFCQSIPRLFFDYW